MDYIKDWKKESGMRLWKEFFAKEYRPKFARFEKTCESMANACGFKHPRLCLGSDGFSMLITGGGPGWFTYHNIRFFPSVTELVSDFENCHHETVNFDFADQLQRLQSNWKMRNIAF